MFHKNEQICDQNLKYGIGADIYIISQYNLQLNFFQPSPMHNQNKEQLFQGYSRDSSSDKELQQLNFGDFEITPPIKLSSQPSDYSDVPVLSYSYSGISNASSNQQFYFTSHTTEEQPIKNLIFLKPSQLYEKSIDKLVTEINKTLFLSKDITLYLIYRYKWSRQRLIDEYFDHAEVYQEKNNKIMAERSCEKNKEEGQCGICCSNKPLIKSLLCQNKYCSGCWQQYIKEELEHGNIFFPCMNQCSISPVLPHSFVEIYFPNLLPLYRKQICINYSNLNKQISYCPSSRNQNCQLFCEQPISLLMSISEVQNSIQCPCGEYYCFECRKQPHFPLSCDDISKWNQATTKVEEGSLEWIEKNTKRCPKCKVAVQKYIGCHYIKCVCGAQFCYECTKKWDEFHKDEKGQCSAVLKRKLSFKQNIETNLFLQLEEKILLVNRTVKKNMKSISNLIELIEKHHINEEWTLNKLKQIKRDIQESWWAYKYCLIGLFIYKKEGVSPRIQDDFLNSIKRVMEIVERMEKNGNKIGYKQLLVIKNELDSKIEGLHKNQSIWIEAWRNC